MKKFNIILAFMCSFSFIAMSQVKIKTDMAEIALPKASHKITKEQRNATLDKKFNVDETMRNHPAINDYELEGLQLSLNYGPVDRSRDYLIELKTNKDRRRIMLQLNDDYYECTISQINGKDVLISRQQGGGFNYYLFNMVNPEFTYSVRGTLKYLPDEESKAKKYLNEILNKIVIKNI